MNKEKTLLILAAGTGSRFGSLKQIEPIGPNGEFLIDYSIYDAIKVGFTKVVFVIKKENEDIFKKTIGNRISKSIKVEYVFQDIDSLPTNYNVPEKREKLWGTSHAILVARDYIDEPFVTINADDFYGRDAYKIASDFLDNNIDNNNYCIIGYKVNNTLSKNGAVKRGICLEKEGQLIKIIESFVENESGMITAKPLDGSETMILGNNHLASMNMFILKPEIFNYIDKQFKVFLDNNLKNDPLKCESSIVDDICCIQKEGLANVFVIEATSNWYGMTYKEDKEEVVSAIRKLIVDGVYPNNLWK